MMGRTTAIEWISGSDATARSFAKYWSDSEVRAPVVNSTRIAHVQARFLDVN